MKRGWKITLALFGGFILVLLLFWIDMHRRTRTALQDRVLELQEDIRRLRLDHSTRPRPFAGWNMYDQARDYLSGRSKASTNFTLKHLGGGGYILHEDELRDVYRSIEEGVHYPYEEGAGHYPLIFIPSGVTRSWELSGDFPPESLLAGEALLGDVYRAGGVYAGESRMYFEDRLLGVWERLLSDHSLDAGKASRYAELMDLIEEDRPTLGDLLHQQLVLERWTVLSMYQAPSTAWHNFEAEPGVGDLFSWKMFFLRVLNELEELYGDYASIARLPVEERRAALRKARLDASRPDGFPTRSEFLNVYRYCRKDAAVRMLIRLRRVALAVVRFEAEMGGYPESLDELVPDYLPSVPICPVSAQSFRYARGSDSAKVWSYGIDGDDDGGKRSGSEGASDGDVVWEIKRRKK